MPAALDLAVREKRLLVVCGAGLSVQPPSAIPSWWDLNRLLLDQIKATAAEVIDGEAARASLAKLSLERLSLVAFSEAIVDAFAGDSYFPVLTHLDSDRCNANHAALADLARMGVLRAVVTTNFDTLIERAFRQVAVPLSVGIGPANDPGGVACRLLKIHGSVTHSTTLVDTVNQKYRGLPAQVREQLKRLFRSHHVLVIGFSGEDLKFAPDYLPFQESEASAGLTWLLRRGSPGQAPAALAGLFARSANCAAVEGELPQFLTDLGATIPAALLDASQDRAGVEEARRISTERLQEAIVQWLAQSYAGPFAAARLTASLLQSSGDFEGARAVRHALKNHPVLNRPAIPAGSGVALRAISEGALADGAPEEAIRWLRKENAYHLALLEAFPPESGERRQEALRNLSAVANQLGVAHRELRQWKEAREAFDQAHRYAEQSGDFQRLATVHMNLAFVSEREATVYWLALDRALGQLRVSLAYALRAGAAIQAWEALMGLAERFLALAEYDSAAAALGRAESIDVLLGDVPRRAHRLACQAELLTRRGRLDEVLKLLATEIAAEEARGAIKVARFLRRALLRLLGFHSPFREVLAPHRTALMATASVESASRRPLTEDDWPSQPLYQYPFALLDEPLKPMPDKEARLDEPQLRHALNGFEAQGRFDRVARCYDLLCQRPRLYQEPARLADAGYALQVAAERAGDAHLQARGLNFQGIAYDRLGEPARAATFYRAALALPDIGDWNRGQVTMHLALVRSQLGEDEGVEQDFTRAEQLLRGAGNREDAVRAVMGLANHLARRGKREAGLAEARRALVEATQLGHPGAQGVLERLVRDLERGSDDRASRGPSAPLASKPEQVDDSELPPLRERVASGAASTPEIANLGMMEDALGNTPVARDLIGRAMTAYSEAGDRLGVSRCLNNLGDSLWREGKREEAVDLTENALAIRRSLGDHSGQVLGLSNLAMRLAKLGRHEQAVNAARQAIDLSKMTPPSRPVAVAHLALVTALAGLGQEAELKVALPEALQRLRSSEEPDLVEIAGELEAKPTDAHPRDVAGRPDALTQGLMEATRLHRLREFGQSLRLLDELSRKHGQTDEHAGYIEGTRGNVLQTAGRHREASAAFGASAAAFRRAGIEDLAVQADRTVAQSLDLSGRFEEARALLLGLLPGLAPGFARSQVLLSLGASLVAETGASLQADPGGELSEADRERLAKARGHYEEASRMPEIDGEWKGVIEQSLAQVDALQGALEDAMKHLLRARDFYIPVNSHRLESVEQQLRAIREQLDP